MTNKLEIDRELLANFIEYSSPISSTDQQWHRDKQELRTLLAADDLRDHCKQCADVVKEWPESKRDCLGTPPLIQTLHANGDRITMEATIAQQAQRIADLERGCVEPVIYEVRIQEEVGNPDESPFFTDYVTKLGAENYKSHHERVTVTPLYASPPAPVAHQEPIAYMRNEGTPNNLVKCTFTCPGAFGVYRQSPAPLLPALPSEDSGTYDYGSYSEGRKHGWNACLDKFKELNQ